MNPWVIAANILGWPIIHLVVASVILRIPLARFRSSASAIPHRLRKIETRFYRRWLAIHRWKMLLPDGAPWLGGFSKKRLEKRDSQYLITFIEEARRAELAHWLMLSFFPIFFLWNPVWADGVMATYAVAANLPCILAQRYNRLVLADLVHRRRLRPGFASAATLAPAPAQAVSNEHL